MLLMSFMLAKTLCSNAPLTVSGIMLRRSWFNRDTKDTTITKLTFHSESRYCPGCISDIYEFQGTGFVIFEWNVFDQSH